MKYRKTAKFLPIFVLAATSAVPVALANGNGGVANAYNNAGQTAQDGSGKQQASATVHTAVSTVCGVACASEAYSAGTTASFCSYGAIGATVMDGNVAGAISGTATAKAGASIGSWMRNEKPAAATQQTTSQRQDEACGTMASEGLSAAAKYQSAKDLNHTANAAFQASNDLSRTGPSAFAPTGDGVQGATSQSGASSASGSGSGIAGGDSGTSACGNASGNMIASIQCAMATDKTIPSFVGTPQFLSALNKATGLTPDQFAQKVQQDGPFKTIGDAVGAAGGGDLGAKTEGLLSAMAQNNGLTDSSTTYAGGGAGGAKTGEGEDPMGKAMQDMLAQLLPKKPGEEDPLHAKELAFSKGPKRYPANVEEDRRVSIFERVTNRYHLVANRVLMSFTAQK